MKCLTKAWQWEPSDVMIHALPLHHVHGVINGLYCAHYTGATISFLPKFSPANMWKQLMVGSLSGKHVQEALAGCQYAMASGSCGRSACRYTATKAEPMLAG